MTLTALQISQINNMNRAAQKAQMGTFLNTLDARPARGSAVSTPLFPQQYSTLPAVEAADAVHAAVTLTAAAQTVTSAITSPDVPRNLAVVGTTGVSALTLTVNGTNINDAAISEAFTMNADTPVVGTKAFKTVTSIVYPARAAGGTITVGTGVKLGFPHILPLASVCIAHYFNGSSDAGTATVDADEVEKNLYAVAGTMDGEKAVDLIYFTA